HLHSVPRPQVFCNLLGQIHRTMLAAGATERHHQICEAAALVFEDAAVHQRGDVRQEFMHPSLLVEIFNDWTVLPGKRFESLLTTGIGQTSAVEYESAAVAAFIFWQPAPMKGEAEDPHSERVCSIRRVFFCFRI